MKLDKYGIESTHSSLYGRLIEYINSQYFGLNPMLQNTILPMLKKEGVIYQEPFIEANQAYEVFQNGIENSKIPIHVKELLCKMIDNDLGVYKDPFSHQVTALEQFFQNKDLFVTTGTGSGKTECFMWPLISSIGNEVITQKETWAMRGVRALVIYPMNALVSDQVGRLRRIIGDESGTFNAVLKDVSNDQNIRMPQFGMYTGRTPYAGDHDEKKDKDLARTLKKDIQLASEEMKNGLNKKGKLPAKIDLTWFIEGLNNGEHRTDQNDAELVTRFEMQQNCPDILITNYSMLEYMLMRQRENSIWNSTIDWLNASKENKLLLVIDEAHMYRGSSGGEVALLIKRLMYRLGINESKIQFILTSASMPHESKEEEKDLLTFAGDLTSRSNPEEAFELIFGHTEELPMSKNTEVDATQMLDISIDDLQTEESKKITAINQFVKTVYNKSLKFNNIKEAQDWLYHNLLEVNQCNLLLKTCRGNATAFNTLSVLLFPDDNEYERKHATQILLAIATLAESKDGKVLFPSRLHMFFRGLNGIYTCTNPNCSEETNSYADGTKIGKIYLDSYQDTCKCGGKIYELINHRRCGALFIKGYFNEGLQGKPFFWQKKGIIQSDGLRELHLYIAPKEMKKSEFKKGNFRWLDSKTGILYEHEQEDMIKVIFADITAKTEDDKGTNRRSISFSTCPKCSNPISNLTDFKTKSNEPFYNIVSAQLMAQPPTVFEEEKLTRLPNAGRKVLLFSDSRQTAARLAKDMTSAADDDAARQAMVKSVIRLHNDKSIKLKSIDMLYLFFLEIACEDNILFFYGDDKDTFKDHVKKMKTEIKKCKKNGLELDHRTLMSKDYKNMPELYTQQLLKLICGSYLSLTDIALCWLEPSDLSDVFEIKEQLEEKKIDLTKDELVMIISNWCNSVVKTSLAIGESIDDGLREAIKPYDYGRYGIKDTTKFQKGIAMALKNKKFNTDQIKTIKNVIIETYADNGLNSGNKFIKTGMVGLRYDKDHKWYKCEKCSQISPYPLWETCPSCGSDKIIAMDQKALEGLSFWRNPVENIINNHEQIKTINTEEHTAQLSHKDQRENMWSTTENFEMRFQDILIDDTLPVDVLSCTTTMEVGIDIGSLAAVALRNVPPKKENYQQRAGRAGRRNASIATITTYAQDGPHDNYYFNNPQKIISGKVQKPWVDVKSSKIIIRHIYIVLFNKFFKTRFSGIDECLTKDFYDIYYDVFVKFLESFIFTKEQVQVLIPKDVEIDIPNLKSSLISALLKLKEDVDIHPEKYYDEKSSQQVTLLSSLFDEGLLPTYSFPKNVVSFNIENTDGKINQKPDRPLDIAISEYAPGRQLVVNKKTYTSGGIYTPSSRFKKGDKSVYYKPAQAYFGDENYFMNIYLCSDRDCGWFSTKIPENDVCLFCGKTILVNKMLKPWGFASVNGKSASDSAPDADYSYAEEPCYSSTPKKDDMKATGYQNIKMANRYNEVITIINKGPESKGFSVCRNCGAAIPTNEEGFDASPTVHTPYNNGGKCNHAEYENVVLGHSFRTDMLVLQITLDPQKINVYSKLWLNSAVISLSEALKLATSRVLDVEYNDIKVGNRTRRNQDEIYVDIYLYDSLSSGAGYSFRIANQLSELIAATEELLKSCKNDCETACHDCLKNFWNKRHHMDLDRKEALELLKWATNSEMHKPLLLNKQEELFSSLKKVLMEDDDYTLTNTNGLLTIECQGISKNMKIVPAMCNPKQYINKKVPIVLSDKMIKHALPQAYEFFKEMFN